MILFNPGMVNLTGEAVASGVVTGASQNQGDRIIKRVSEGLEIQL